MLFFKIQEMLSKWDKESTIVQTKQKEKKKERNTQI